MMAEQREQLPQGPEIAPEGNLSLDGYRQHCDQPLKTRQRIARIQIQRHMDIVALAQTPDRLLQKCIHRRGAGNHQADFLFQLRTLIPGNSSQDNELKYPMSKIALANITTNIPGIYCLD
jgi:hypothetical protein